jgi:hypothetical protein
MGTIKTTNIEPIADNGTVTLGSSGDTFTIPSGATLDLSNATQTGVGGVNTPSFGATMSANQSSISSGTNTLVAFDTESWDTDSAYDNTSGNYKFTVPSGEAGKYFITAHLHFRGSGTYSGLDVRLYKNGSFLVQTKRNSTSNYLHSGTTNNIEINTLVNLSVGDYIQVYGQALGTTFDIMEEGAYFSAYKLIGV